MDMTLSQVLDGFMLAARARRLADATVMDYGYAFKRLQRYLGDPVFERIGVADARGFMAAQTDVGRKSLLNYHIALSALWTWTLREGLATVHVMRSIPAPKAPPPAIVAFTLEEIKAILKATERSQAYHRPGQKEMAHRPAMAERNKAIVLLLLDTGIRASELVGLRRVDVDLRNKRVTVLGKGAKQRMVPFSDRTAQALWRYETQRPESREVSFFLTMRGAPMNRGSLLQVCGDLGERANVADCHPHRFRHTFALMSLRNGMNVFVLQQLMGHTSLIMTRRYLALVESDLEGAHQQASPVANWRL